MFSFFKRSKNRHAAPAAVAEPAGPAVAEAPTPQAVAPPPAATPEPTPTPAPAAAATPPTPEAPVMNGDLNVGALLEPPAAPVAAPAFGAVDEARTEALKPSVVEAISTVFDPEIPVNIYELGLVYEILADADGNVLVRMTLTSPACPSAQQLPSEVRYKVKAIEGVSDCTVDIVWEPPWTKDMMSETARLSLGIF